MNTQQIYNTKHAELLEAVLGSIWIFSDSYQMKHLKNGYGKYKSNQLRVEWPPTFTEWRRGFIFFQWQQHRNK
jgi:hypothetical protein